MEYDELHVAAAAELERQRLGEADLYGPWLNPGEIVTAHNHPYDCDCCICAPDDPDDG